MQTDKGNGAMKCYHDWFNTGLESKAMTFPFQMIPLLLAKL